MVWLITALHAVLLISYTVLQPTWRAPDEPFHVDLVTGVAAGEGYPPYDQRPFDRGVLGSLPLVQFAEGSRHLLRSEAVPRDDRPARAELRDEGRDVDLLGGSRGLNHMTQHPPAYYLYMAATSVVTDALAPGSGFGSYDREVGVMRILSLLLVVPLPLLAWATGRAVGAPQTVSVAAAVVPLGVPQLTHIGAAVNNDALLLLAMGALTPVAVRFATGHVTRGGVVAAGALTGIALLAKAFAFVVPVWMAVAIVVGVRHRRRWAPAVGGYLAVAFVTGGWWWAVNLVRYGSISPSIEYARLNLTGAGSEPDYSRWLVDWVPNMSERFWGSFGWVEAPLPDPWTTTATAVVVVLVVASLIGRRRALPGAVTVTLLAPTLLLAAFVFVGGLRLYRLTAVAAMVQGRYLLGGIVGLAVLLAVGLARLLGRRAALAPVLLLLAAGAMQLRAVATLLDTFWGPPGSSAGDSLAAAGAWSPWPPGVLLALTATAAVTMVAAGVSVLRFTGLGHRRNGA